MPTDDVRRATRSPIGNMLRIACTSCGENGIGTDGGAGIGEGAGALRACAVKRAESTAAICGGTA